jgi:predicted porin
MAQSSVTITGAVDVAYADKQVSSATGANLISAKGIAEGQNTANRLNFDIKEDLGGGLKAQAMFETGLNITNVALLTSRAAAAGPNVVSPTNASQVGTSTTADIPTGAYSVASQNRQSYVGLSGGFGEVRLGYQRTNLYEQATYSGYLVGQEQFGGFLHTLGQASFGGTRSNAITYITPKYNGFAATVQVGSGTGREDFATDTATGINGYTAINQKRTAIKVDYANGPLNATYGRTVYDEKTVAGTTTTVADIYGAISATAAASTDFRGTVDQLTGSYEIGSLKLTGQYLKGTKDLASGNDLTYKATVLGGIYTMGNAAFFAMTGNGTIDTAGTAAHTNDYTSTQYGVRYSLSKRTIAYAMNGVSKDKAQTSATATSKGTVTAIGLAHSF